MYDLGLLNYNTYSDYIDAFVTLADRRYLANKNHIKFIVSLGLRGVERPYSEKEFERRQFLALQSVQHKSLGIISYGDYINPNTTDPVLMALYEREIPNVLKFVATIVFIMVTQSNGTVISSYFDLEMRLRDARLQKPQATDWQGVFEGRVRLEPTTSDLSYLNTHGNVVKSTSSDNFRVLEDYPDGMLFMHKGDLQRISVASDHNKYSKNATCTMLHSPKMGFVVFYDHIVRKKA